MAGDVEISNGKQMLLLTLALGCFAVLWPKIFLPMLQGSLFGPPTTTTPSDSVGGAQASLPVFPYNSDGASRRQLNIKTPPSHMHARLMDMRQMMGQSATEGQSTMSRAGGVMSVVMPLYTVIIAGFLGFTLFKLLFKKDDHSCSSSSSANSECRGRKPLLTNFHMHVGRRADRWPPTARATDPPTPSGGGRARVLAAASPIRGARSNVDCLRRRLEEAELTIQKMSRQLTVLTSQLQCLASASRHHQVDTEESIDGGSQCSISDFDEESVDE